MDKKSLQTLEFHKILERLSGHTITETGRDAALHLTPCETLHEANEMQTETAEAVTLITRRGSVPILCRKDIRGSVKRADMGGALSPQELNQIRLTLATARRLKSYPDEVPCDLLSGHIEAVYADRELENRISLCITEENEVADDASPELYQIRRKIRSSTGKIKDILQDIVARRGKLLQEPIITMRGDRYVIPVKSEHKSEIKGIVHDTSSTGATLFIEPIAVVEAGNEIRALQTKETEEIERILLELSGVVAQSAKLLDMSWGIIVHLDGVFARAKYALATDAYRPVLNDAGIVNLQKARHPLLDPKTVVPTDIMLGKDFDTLVVTGPNTGGKTVVLKTLGLLSLMAACGMHVTAQEESDIAVFADIFADIGDEQSIEQSLSTFSSHMVNIVNILKRADHRSLCLFDELGAGTDPIEGAALAVSILEDIRLRGAKCAATTHYSELKLYALTGNRVENASCEFNVETLMPTYRLLIGVPGKSNAFAISSRLGLSDAIIEDARGRIAGENIKFEDVLTELEKNRRTAEREKDRALAYKRETELIKRTAETKQQALQEKSDRIIEAARQEAKKILEDAKAESDAAIRAIREAQRQKDTREANRALEKSRSRLNEKTKEHAGALSHNILDGKKASKPPKTVKPGDDVEVVNLGQRGIVVTEPDSKGNLYVRVGVMKLQSNLSYLRLAGEQAAAPKTRRNGVSRPTEMRTATISPELDVRGETIDEAVYRIEKQLSDALLSSLTEVRIIHGKGTGALRNGIHAWLRTQPYIAEFHLASFGEGDAGVTVVRLK